MSDKNKLFGLPFEKDILNQLEYRAAQLGGGEKDVESLMQANNRGAWVTLSSGAQTTPDADIAKKNELIKYINKQKYNYLAEEEVEQARNSLKLLEEGKAGKGNSLALANILSGGTLVAKYSEGDSEGTSNVRLYRRTGINFGQKYNEIGNQSNYEHSPELGFKPMMGITDVKIKTQSAFGSIKRATITIKAHTPDQLSILETLYFRPGFSMLLEWGNSAYVDKIGQINSYNYGLAKRFCIGAYENTVEEDPDTGEKIKVSAIQHLKRDIALNREDSGYNYDGMVGKVVNFSWSIAPDLSYDCTIDIMSEGQVIDAVRTTYITPADSKLVDFQDNNQAELAGGRDDVLIDTLNIFKKSNDIVNKAVKDLFPNSKIFRYNSLSMITDYENEEGEDAQNDKTRNYFICLRDFCYIFNKMCLDTQDTGNIKLSFNTKFTDDKMVTFPGHISNDPAVCMMPYRKGTAEFGVNSRGKELKRTYTRESYLYGNQYVNYVRSGQNDVFLPKPEYNKTMSKYTGASNIWVPLESAQAAEWLPKKHKDFKIDSPLKILLNIDHLIKIQESFIEQKNEDHEVEAVVSQFFNRLLGDINTALGDINNLSLFFDEDTNVWHIIDLNNFDTELPGTATLADKPPLLNVVGLKTEISDLKIESKISDSLFNSLAVTATAGGQDIGEVADNMNRYNLNVSDRYEPFIPEDKPSNKRKSEFHEGGVWSNRPPSDLRGNPAYIHKGPYAVGLAYRLYCVGLEDGEVMRARQYSTEAFDSAKEIHRKMMKAVLIESQAGKRQSGKVSSFSGGLLPIELSFTMRGIAGLKIGEAFTINEELLPKRNRGVIGFSITSIDNSIGADNNWITNVGCTMYNLPAVEISQGDIKEEPAPEPKKENPPPADPSTPNANRLRAAIAANGYSEKHKSGDPFNYSVGELTSALEAKNPVTGQRDIGTEITDFGISIIKDIKKEVPDIKLIFTGGNDAFHHNPNWDYVSRHAVGNALDFVIEPYSVEAYNKVLKIIREYAAGEDDKVRYQDEYKALTANASGQHFHISYGSGREGLAELKADRKAAEAGRIEKRKIT